MAQIILEEGAAQATPATGKVSLYAKTDGNLYAKDDAGTETQLGVTGGVGDFKADGSVPMTGSLVMGANTKIIFEGTTADDYETTLDPGEPTADRTITLPNASGTVLTNTDIGGSVQAYDIDTTKNDVANTFTAVQTFGEAARGSQTSLSSSAASIAISLSDSNFFTHTFTENTTLANPTNIVAGQEGIIVFTQHASSPKTLAFGGYYKFPGGTVPTVTATNSAVDVMAYYVVSSTFIACKFLQDVK